MEVRLHPVGEGVVTVAGEEREAVVLDLAVRELPDEDGGEQDEGDEEKKPVLGRLWLADDETRLPLRAECQTPFGRVVVELAPEDAEEEAEPAPAGGQSLP